MEIASSPFGPLAMTVCDVDKINRPSHLRRAISFDLSICQLAKLRPTMRAIVIVIIIVIIGEAELVDHDGGIIAQSYSSN